MMMKLMMMMMMVVSSNCEVGVESEDNSGKDLISACAEGPDNVEEIVRILRNGANPNVATEDGESALHLACIWGGGDKIRVLLDAGADPNYRSSQKASSLDMTPLSWYVLSQHQSAPTHTHTHTYIYTGVHTLDMTTLCRNLLKMTEQI